MATVTRSKTVVVRQSYALPCCTQINTAETTGDNGGNDELIVGTRSDGDHFRSLLIFDFDALGIPSSATITSAVVRMTTSDVDDGTARDISLHRALVEIYPGNGSGGTDYSTWANRNQNTTTAWVGGAGGGSGDDYAATATDTVSVEYIDREYEWDVTDDVQDFIDGTHEPYGWFVINDDQGTTSSLKRFHSEFASGVEGNPYLIIKYTEDVETAAADWYGDGWQYRKEITIDSSQVGSDLTNFPLLVDLTGDADVTANAAVNNYRDVLFTDSDGLTKLEHELAGHPWEMAADSGAYIFFGDPSAVRHNGTNDKTYLAYVNRSGGVIINAYDHTSESWDGEFTLKSGFQADDHINPTILVRDDGHIMVFYGAHSGTEVYLRISTNAEDISAFDAEQTLDSSIGDDDYGYWSPVQLTGETDDPIYLFYTKATHPRRLRYSKSTDGGATWSAFTTVFEPPGSRVYFHIVQNGTSRIDFAVTDSDPSISTTSIYHFYYEGGDYYQSDGTQIAASLPLETSDITQIHDGSTDGSSWIWDIAIDGSGNPVVGYQVTEGGAATDHRYWYGKWNGTSWDTTEITSGGDGIKFQGGGSYYSGGIALNHGDLDEVWVSKPKNGVHNIFKYSTSDGGSTWVEGEQLTGSMTLPHFRPIYVRNAHADLQVFWMYGYYPDFDSFQTAILCDLETAEAKFWVKIPSVSSSVDTTFYVYYGNANAPPQATDEMVWDGVYDLVLHGWFETYRHIHYTKPPRTFLDSWDRSLREQDGTIFKEIDVSGASSAINMSTINMRGWTAITYEALVEHDSSGGSEHTIINNTGSARPGALLRIEPSNDTVEGFVRAVGTFPGGTFTGLTATPNEVKRYALRYNDANGLEGFVDKNKSTNSFGSGSGTLETSADSNDLTAASGSSGDPLSGTIEEIRISQNYLSDEWLDYVYDNIFDNANTVSAGTEEEGGGNGNGNGGDPEVGTPRSGVAIMSGVAMV